MVGPCMTSMPRDQLWITPYLTTREYVEVWTTFSNKESEYTTLNFIQLIFHVFCYLQVGRHLYIHRYWRSCTGESGKELQPLQLESLHTSNKGVKMNFSGWKLYLVWKLPSPNWRGAWLVSTLSVSLWELYLEFLHIIFLFMGPKAKVFDEDIKTTDEKLYLLWKYLSIRQLFLEFLIPTVYGISAYHLCRLYVWA